jgi:hypothetical protein
MGTWKIPITSFGNPTGSTTWSPGDMVGGVIGAGSGTIDGFFPADNVAIYLDGSVTPTSLLALPSGFTPDSAYTFRWEGYADQATDTIDISIPAISASIHFVGPSGAVNDHDVAYTGCTVAVLLAVGGSTVTATMVCGSGAFVLFGDVVANDVTCWFNGTYTTSAPVVTSITPSSGSVNGGQTVTIRGTGFTGATLVEFGGTSVTFTPSSDTTGTAVTPPHTFGAVDVEVMGVATLAGGYTFVIQGLSLPPIPSQTPIMQGGGRKRG